MLKTVDMLNFVLRMRNTFHEGAITAIDTLKEHDRLGKPIFDNAEMATTEKWSLIDLSFDEQLELYGEVEKNIFFASRH